MTDKNKEKVTESDEALQQEGQKMTPEEYKEMRAKNMKHMKEEIEYLEVEKKYENLVADVEEAKTRSITMVAQRARFFVKQEDQPKDQPKDKPRKLKRQVQ